MLRQGSPEEIKQMFNRMNRESRQVVKSILQLVYFMRGSIQYGDMLLLSHAERDMINDFIKERLEAEGKKIHPVY